MDVVISTLMSMVFVAGLVLAVVAGIFLYTRVRCVSCASRRTTAQSRLFEYKPKSRARVGRVQNGYEDGWRTTRVPEHTHTNHHGQTHSRHQDQTQSRHYDCQGQYIGHSNATTYGTTDSTTQGTSHSTTYRVMTVPVRRTFMTDFYRCPDCHHEWSSDYTVSRDL